MYLEMFALLFKFFSHLVAFLCLLPFARNMPFFVTRLSYNWDFIAVSFACGSTVVCLSLNLIVTFLPSHFSFKCLRKNWLAAEVTGEDNVIERMS